MTNPLMADAFRLKRQGRGVAVEFGRLDGVPLGATPPRILLTDRVTLSLETARRLAVSLEEALRPYAAQIRAEEAKAMAPSAAAIATKPNQVSARPPEDTSGTKAAQLLRMVGDWGIPHQYERSLQLRPGSLQSNRFLLTVNTRDIAGDPVPQVLSVCRTFAMPRGMQDQAELHFPMAKCVHFGFEGGPDSIVCKLYLEADIPADEARRARAANQPVLMHLAFKWDLLCETAVTTRYHWYPGLTAEEIEAQMADIYRAGHPDSLDTARSLLAMAVERSSAHALQYLEVQEVENKRRSYDLNIYNAGLAIQDIAAPLQRMRTNFGIRPGQFQAVYDQIKTLALGHFSGGVHRDGRDFFNLYYGAVGLPHFNERLS